MDDYTNVTLIKITEERTIVIDGEMFLIVDAHIFNTLKTKRNSRPYTDTTELQNQIIDILTEKPGIRSGLLREYLDKKYSIRPSDNVMRSCLQRMKDMNKVRVEGDKNRALWYVVDLNKDPKHKKK